MKTIKKRSIALLLLLCFSWLITTPSLMAQSTNENYIAQRTYIDTLGHYTTTIQYFDGLGRPYRTVQKDAVSPGVDLVTATQYDSQGRDSVKWLPVAGYGGLPLTDAEIRLQAAAQYNGDSRPYTLNLYEPSALNRISKSFGPGEAWSAAGKSVNTSYLSNSLTDSSLICRKYVVKDAYTFEKKGDYPAASLDVTETTDEDGRRTFTFKNLSGQVLLIRSFSGEGGSASDTYYVYDRHGMLCWVLPPQASDALASDGVYDRTTEALGLNAYYYRYDGRQNLVARQLPGCAPVEYWRDKAGRVALMQDGNLRSNGQFEYTYYDAFGRVTQTGLCKLNTVETAERFRNYTYTVYAKSTFDASYPDGYRPQMPGGLPVTDKKPLSVSYYDRYDFLSLPGFSGKSEFTSSSENATGNLTGSLSVVFGSADTIRTVYHYDRHGRLCRTVADNLAGGYDREETTYTFTGLVKTRTKVHTSSRLASPLTELYTYTYDDWGKLLATDHRLNGDSTVRLSANRYDALGRLSEQTVNNNTYSTSYSYNIRGWQTAQCSPLFSQRLNYHTGPGKACYNGNISSMMWQGGGESVLRGYQFYYDGHDRLTSSVYGEGANLSTNVNRYTENLSYDKMGNILSLQRYGQQSSGAYGPVDDLSLVYWGNQLRKVTDRVVSGVASPDGMHFTDGAAQETEYAYDGNGNLTSDLNRSIRKIAYNPLNLPQAVLFAGGDSIGYRYDASGNKLRVAHRIGLTTSVTDYSGNMIYEDGILDKLFTENGYITFSGATPVYHYYLSDYLGNNRVVMKSDGSAEQVTHYYPFGSVLGDSRGSDVQRWKFGNKELDGTGGVHWYDFTARFYDPVVPSFCMFDPCAEQSYSSSPYSYCGNNPVKNIDPTGRSKYRLNSHTGSLTLSEENDDAEDEIEVWAMNPVMTPGDHFYTPRINTRPGYEKTGASLKVTKGVLPDRKEDLSQTGFTSEGYLSEAVGVMNFISMNSNLELNAWAYQDDDKLENLKVNGWFDSTFKASKQDDPPGNGSKLLYNVHTHPGNGYGIGGDGKPSSKDFINKSVHPYVPYYIISRNQGLTVITLDNAYPTHYYSADRKTTHPSLRKYIKLPK